MIATSPAIALPSARLALHLRDDEKPDSVAPRAPPPSQPAVMTHGCADGAPAVGAAGEMAARATAADAVSAAKSSSSLPCMTSAAGNARYAVSYGWMVAFRTSGPSGPFALGSCSAVTSTSKLFNGVTVSKVAFRFLSTFSCP